MEQIVINAVKREPAKKSSRKLARQNKIAGIIYGEKKEPFAIAIDYKEFQRAINKGGETAIYKINVEGKEIPSLLRDIQRDPVTYNVIHADFLRISMDKEITTEVPIEIKGKAKGVEMGGILEVRMHELEIECLPANIPKSIEIDVSNLEIGDTVHVGDVVPPEGVKIISEPQRTIVVISPPTVSEAAHKEAPEGEVQETATQGEEEKKE